MPLDYLDPNGDILELARQAGYLPPEAPPNTSSGLILPGDEAESPSVPEENDSYLSPANRTPRAMDGGLTAPDYVPSNMGPGLSGSTGSEAGLGMGYRGFNQGKYDEISGKPEKGLEGDYQKSDAMAQAGANRMIDASFFGVQEEKQAAKDIAAAQGDKAMQAGRDALIMQRLQDDFAADEARINAEATAASNQSKADYIAALADFRAAKVDPAQLWHNMTGGERFGMLATAFVHDFLGARGINTSAMATFNKAIDRNIDAQIQAIKNKGEVAEGFKSLWYMQRNQAASDAEARARVRGFLLEGTKQQVIANMAQYESALATAQGQAAVAAIDRELSKTLVEIYKHADQNAIALRNQALEKWRAKLQASLEQQNINLRAKELEQKKAEANKQKGNPLAKYLPDTTASGQGKLRYEIYAGTPQKQDEIREQMGAIGNFDNLVGQFQELSRKVGTIAPSNLASFLRTPDGARLLALRDSMARNLAYAKSGKQVNESEFTHFRNQIPIETWLTNGSREKIWAQTNEILRDEAFSSMQAFVRPIGDNETIDGPDGNSYRLRDITMSPHFNAPGSLPSDVPGEAKAIENRAIINPPPPDQAERIRTEADKYLRPADKKSSIANDEEALTEGIVEAKADFLKQNPEFLADRKKTVESDPLVQRGIIEVSGAGKEEVPVTRSDKGLLMLARAAQGGDKKALEQLKTYAGEYINKGMRDEESMFASYLLNEIAPGAGDSKMTGE